MPTCVSMGFGSYFVCNRDTHPSFNNINFVQENAYSEACNWASHMDTTKPAHFVHVYNFRAISRMPFAKVSKLEFQWSFRTKSHGRGPLLPSSLYVQSVPLQIVNGKDKLKLNVTYVCTRMLPIYLTTQWTRTNINLFAAYRSDAPTRRMVPHFFEVDGIHGPVEALFAP